jgi:uncharacterized membrane protein YraQ (UPF0718 family)
MSLVVAFSFVAAVLIGLAAFASRRRPEAHAQARAAALGYLKSTAPRLPFALFAAECLGRLLPPALISDWIGAGSGMTGVLIASGVGALLPGGPMLAFPLAIALERAGAGPEALVALITGWALIAVMRTLIFEIPMLGGRFARWRLALCLPLPVAAGAIAAGLAGP